MLVELIGSDVLAATGEQLVEPQLCDKIWVGFGLHVVLLHATEVGLLGQVAGEFVQVGQPVPPNGFVELLLFFQYRVRPPIVES